MMYAWPKHEVDRTDLNNRIQADLHQDQEGCCPLHGCAVKSTLVNDIWQPVHEAKCRGPRRAPR